MKPRLPKPLNVSQSHITDQVERLHGIIKDTFKNNEPRITALQKMYSDLLPLLRHAPASAKVQYHNSYSGGYIDHIIHVIDNALRVTKMFVEMGGVPDCTDVEVVFAAMHHDLGKLGDDDGPVYMVENDEFWNKKGSWFDYNDLRQKMTTFDRTIFLLQEYNVKFTKNEMIGIRMADGVFDPGNKPYFDASAPFAHRTNIGYIIHWADWMSTIAEKDVMRKQFELINNND